VPQAEELDGVHRGIIEATSTGHGFQLDLFPAAGLFHQRVGGLTAVQLMMWTLVGGGNEFAAQMYEEKLNVHYVGAAEISPPEVFAHSTVPIETVEDLQGLKMRAIGESGEVMKEAGVSTVYMPGGEIYEAAARGVIDAFEYSPPSVNWPQGFHEVAEYLYLSPVRAPTMGYGFWVNADSWAEITPDLQTIVSMAVNEELQRYHAELVVWDAEALEKYIDYGTKVQNLSKEVEDHIASVGDEFYAEKAAGDPFYAEILDSQNAFREICVLQDIR
jgi:TRAP-type mannitol/chloroaromatic compound transport system substrate-binding protein